MKRVAVDVGPSCAAAMLAAFMQIDSAVARVRNV
jgi:hypothetical protein